ncbi:hypothetical protein HNY73_019415 [Argiope bruennichi]|uniref:Uncharacterized protein n=1 Tax=Argiope bruennichi TaxID=94029 RepID=A0A8T0E601_ARGBR|nr:hypothetical protein HNY73_019415 [Argiope bruennichi]
MCAPLSSATTESRRNGPLSRSSTWEGNESWRVWWLEMSLDDITSKQNRNDKVSSGSIEGHHHKKKSKAIHTCSGKVMLTIIL